MTRRRRRDRPTPAGPVRLHKALSHAGVASRRASERLIAEGRVSVNGRPVTELPAWVDPSSDRVEIDGKGVGRPRPRGHQYILVNKPRKVLCTNHDPEARRTVRHLVPHATHLFCVGRLDADSGGMVLLTNDGALANRLMHPSHGVAKTYLVSVRGRVDEADVEKLRRGTWHADKRGRRFKAHLARLRVVRRERDHTRLEVVLHEGRNRQIRRMIEGVGYKVRRLERVAIGSVRLKGVARGEWRELTRGEVRALRKSAGMPVGA